MHIFCTFSFLNLHLFLIMDTLVNVLHLDQAPFLYLQTSATENVLVKCSNIFPPSHRNRQVYTLDR
jgi:hypothetical protein